MSTGNAEIVISDRLGIKQKQGINGHNYGCTSVHFMLAYGHQIVVRPVALIKPVMAEAEDRGFEGEAVMSNAHDHAEIRAPADDVWDVFQLDDDGCEPEPERGDFWEEVDDDYGDGG
jgi:hypothetical protein